MIYCFQRTGGKAMYKNCQTESSAQRQRVLEKGLLQMMLHKRYEDISVSDLCEYLHIPRKAFYRYFTGKDGALFALIDHTLGDFFQMPVKKQGSGDSALGDLERYFHFWYEHRELLDALQINSLSGILVERATSFTLHERHMALQLRHIPPEIHGLAIAFSVCGLMSVLLQWHQQGFQIPPDKMARLAAEILTKPLLTL